MKRRRFLIGMIAAMVGVAGCNDDRTDGERESPTASASRTPTPSATPTPETPATDTPTETEDDSSSIDPDVTLEFGESYVDTALEITVEQPILETTFDYDGETYEMPEGSALVIAPLTFGNTHDSELRPVDGPLFTLVSDESTTLETHDVDHPAFDPSLRIRRMENVPTTLRWTSHGAAVEPGERLDGTAVFEVSSDVDPTTIRIVYESDRIRDDRFGDEDVAWERAAEVNHLR